MLKGLHVSDTILYFRGTPRSSAIMHKDGVSQESQPHSSTEVLSTKTRRPSASTYRLICSDPTPSGGSSTSEAGSQIPPSEPSASSTDVSATQTKSDRVEQQMRFAAPGAPPRKDVVDIPGNRGGKKVYFTVAVQTPDCDAEVWKQKFSYFYKLLNDAINSRQDLRDQLRPGRELLFEMHMVGKTLETARPSVVVFCFYKHFEELKKLFRKRLQDQMNCEKRFSDYLNLPRRSQDSNNKVDLVYFCVDRCPIERKASEDTLAAYSETAATWCGGLVKSGSLTSTLGPAIYAPDFLGVLTVDHIFHPTMTSSSTWESQREEDVLESSPTLGPLSDSSEQQNKLELWLEDTDEYDFDDITWQPDSAIAEDAKASAQETVSVNSYHDTNGDVVMAEWQRVLPKASLDDKAPYLDWALVRPILETHYLPNIFYPDGLDHKPVAITGIFKESPAHWARVFMVSGIRGILKGHILASYSVLGPIASYDACETWTVILDSDSGTADILLEGECGSLIIDRKSGEIYGHVVACGPLGQVYVSPMKHVLNQIQTCFEREEVQIISDQASGTSTSTKLESARDLPSYSELDPEVFYQPQQLRQQGSSALGDTHPYLVKHTDKMASDQQRYGGFTEDDLRKFQQEQLEYDLLLDLAAKSGRKPRNHMTKLMMEHIAKEKEQKNLNKNKWMVLGPVNEPPQYSIEAQFDTGLELSFITERMAQLMGLYKERLDLPREIITAAGSGGECIFHVFANWLGRPGYSGRVELFVLPETMPLSRLLIGRNGQEWWDGLLDEEPKDAVLWTTLSKAKAPEKVESVVTPRATVHNEQSQSQRKEEVHEERRGGPSVPPLANERRKRVA